MRIGDCDTDKRVLVIAEIGNNHEGDFGLAKELIHLAAAAGADAVKFQSIVPERLVSRLETKRIEVLSKFAFTYDQFRELARCASDEEVIFLTTPFDVETARALNDAVPAWKIASGDNNFIPLIETVAETGKPIILSTGLAGLDEIVAAKNLIEGVWKRSGRRGDLALLHCVSSYPTPPAEANLAFITVLATLGVTPGYSDHTIGIEAAVLSVAAGARIIEKHFTISKKHSDFPDHKLSADPADLAELVERVEEAALLLGDGRFRSLEVEAPVLAAARRSVVARVPLDAGAVVSRDCITWVRPGGGLPPGRESEIIGKTLAVAKKAGEMILPADCR